MPSPLHLILCAAAVVTMVALIVKTWRELRRQAAIRRLME